MAALTWMEKQAKADQPFFAWYNSTAMHFRTHVADKNLGKSDPDPYSDRMVVHDEQIGMMLDKLDELGIADNTIVMYSYRQRPGKRHLAGRSQHPRSEVEGLVGGWMAGAVLHALAGPHQGRIDAKRHRQPH